MTEISGTLAPATARRVTAVPRRSWKVTSLRTSAPAIGVRQALVEAPPWLPMAVYKAFAQSKAIALEHLSETSATKVTLPFVEEQFRRARALMGADGC
ncbi:MAG TPA: hypothetical protein VLA00_16445 [Xanthobacteraceae bacterium]|nr:hypothetical protein [Xanthobacteraceae bacterium]